MTYWESAFLQSKVNRGAYDGDRLPTQNWTGLVRLGSKSAYAICERHHRYSSLRIEQVL
jgi:hypothetical protein